MTWDQKAENKETYYKRFRLKLIFLYSLILSLILYCQRNMKLLATLATVALAASKEEINAIYQGKDQKSFYTVTKNWWLHFLSA